MNNAWYQDSIQIHTNGRGTHNITQQVANMVANSGIKTGLCQCFVQHTSASLIICENADPDVRLDVESWMQKNVIDDDPIFLHRDDGPDDMSAHIRSILTSIDMTVPIVDGQLGLGLWQGLYLFEHRAQSHYRKIIVTLQGTEDK
jgi:secondary thiamine-phosphate synthase enzyme